jgi:ketosteroid isomerase-like protein
MDMSLIATLAVLVVVPVTARSQEEARHPSETVVLEVRSYNLKPGRRDSFHDLFTREALPLLAQAGTDVVAYGPSLHDGDSYFLMRAFTSLDSREREEDAFYGSAEWHNGPRAAVLAAIDRYTTIVITVDRATLASLRGNRQTHAPSSDLDTLLRLNHDYIESVRRSDVERFREILGDDFLCTLPDGSIVDREAFLLLTAKPSGLPRLEAHDVDVRLLGDVAIVHARTTFTRPDGTSGSGRYTDVWARRHGRWVAVAAHVTRR